MPALSSSAHAFTTPNMVSTFPPHAQVWVHHTPLTSSPDLIDNSERYILVFVTRRKAGVSREQFLEHYEKVSSVELLSPRTTGC